MLADVEERQVEEVIAKGPRTEFHTKHHSAQRSLTAMSTGITSRSRHGMMGLMRI